jgi:Zn-dependent protease
MTSPRPIAQPIPKVPAREASAMWRLGVPFALFVATMLSTTAMGMRYMHNFHLGLGPLATDADVLPYTWVMHNLPSIRSGLPFSLALIGILLAHEFGHYFACRACGVRSTLPYLLPAPSLSGTFGAVIRLNSRVGTRAALLIIGAAGPIAGFLVAIVAATLGIYWSTYAPTPTIQHIQAPLVIAGIDSLLRAAHGSRPSLTLVVPHPVLIASWIGMLITALNLIPAGQLDGGHILYAISPRFHRIGSRVVTALMFILGIVSWAGWIFWGIILLLPAMRHPMVTESEGIGRRHYAAAAICLGILLLAGTLQPFTGYSLIDLIRDLLD